MRVLFLMRSTVYARNFEWTLRLLAQRGHQVHIVADKHPLPGLSTVVERLCREHPEIRHTQTPALSFNALTFLGTELRRALDALRYLQPEFAGAVKLRARAARGAPGWLEELRRRPLLRSAAGQRLMKLVLRLGDRAMPRDADLDAFIGAERPDLVLVTPLVEPGSPQATYLRSARAFGVPTALCVYSWDNLTNKGLIHDPVDLVAVWNEAMKREAVELHGVPAARVAVTGAVPYDHWFTWTAQSSRDAFVSRVGLPAGRPYLLYLCSSKFIAPQEVAFVRRWVNEIRALEPALRDVGVLVRPHPQNAAQWMAADLSDLEGVAVWPRAGADPSDDASRADYFESIHHSLAVVGLNTSAQIEAAIAGRGVYTVLDPEFRDTQEGTLHFHHLSAGQSGVLQVATNMAEHAAQLAKAVAGGDQDEARRRRFIESFVRPYGLSEPAAPRLVQALEATAATGPRRPYRGPFWAPLVRPLLSRLAPRVTHSKRGVMEQERARIHAREQRAGADVERKNERSAAKKQANAARALEKEQNAARRAAARQAEAETAARAFEHYLHVRAKVGAMRQADGHTALSLAEQERHAALAPLWDASPADIASLRRWCEPISGVRAADYDVVSQDLKFRLGRDLHMMQKQTPDWLFVQEPTTLGGFGALKSGERFNADTLRHFKAMAALHDGAVLEPLRRSPDRRLVWEIGGGWGGFAYQFKTVCPNVTYVISGAPDLFLVSAVYLMTVFPDARVRFHCDDVPPEALWQDWETVDFVFVPERAVPTLALPRLDLVLDIMALRDMTAERATRHVERAFELGAPYVYSLLPSDRKADEAPRVWEPMERLFWPNPVPPRVDKNPPAPGPDDGPLLHSDYAHLVGWRRLLV